MRNWVSRPVWTGLAVAVIVFCAQVGAAWAQDSSPPPQDSSGQNPLMQAIQKAQEAAAQAAEKQRQVMGQVEAAETGVATEPKDAAKPKAPTVEGEVEGITDIRMTLEGAFDMHIQDADVRTVLRQLSIQAKKNIVASPSVTGKITADLYGVTFLEALDALVQAAGMAYEAKDQVYFVSTPAEMEARQKEQETVVRVFPLRYLTATDARELIKGMLSGKGKVMVTPQEHTGIEYIVPTQEFKRVSNIAEDVLVVQDYRDIVEAIAKVITKVDIKPPQVLIEATILSVQLTENNSLGVDLQVLTGLSFNTFGVTSNLANMNAATASVKTFDHWQSRLNTAFSGNLPNTLGTVPSFGIVSDQLAMFIQALDSIGETTVLANPKLLVVNKQRAEVLIGRKDGYLTTVVTDTSAIQKVEFLETGTKLTVRPFVGEGEVIRLEISPEDSTGTVAPVGTGINAPVLPSSTTTTVTTNIMVRDGRTVVIGGLFRNSVGTTRRQIPIVGDVPWLGTMFRSTVDIDTRQEVIILITPHLVKDTSQEAIGERMLMDAERYRIGARSSLRWWGRERLCESYLRRATQSWACGDEDSAWWWLDLTLSLQPDLMEAMLLKERMTDRAAWAQPPQYTTTRYLITKMILQQMGKPAEDVLIPDRPLNERDIDPEIRRALGIAVRPSQPGGVRPGLMLQPPATQSPAAPVEAKPTPPPIKQPFPPPVKEQPSPPPVKTTPVKEAPVKAASVEEAPAKPVEPTKPTEAPSASKISAKPVSPASPVAPVKPAETPSEPKVSAKPVSGLSAASLAIQRRETERKTLTALLRERMQGEDRP